ncbi:Abi family protein [Deinococcus metallilatus]|nr:Abi family protein [Deinococcus metallilatus]MBB5297483.1 hypothetical protein [Deinococcus metallilatus]
MTDPPTPEPVSPNPTTVIVLLSQARLSTYPGADDASRLANYAKNARLSEALFPVLQHLEICLRNRWETVFVMRFGDAWYNDATLDRLLDDYGQEELRKAKKKLRDRKRPLSSGAVVAENTFGFWTSLFGRRYEKTLWVPNARNLLPHAMPTDRNIHNIRVDLEMIRKLRNRLAHHEPILLRSTLWDDYETALKWLNWIAPEVREWLKTSGVDRFPEVYEANKP